MTAEELVYPVLGSVVMFISLLAVPLLGLAILRMIGGER